VTGVAYLVNAGATAVTAPNADQIGRRHPERGPSDVSPMTFDDLME